MAINCVQQRYLCNNIQSAVTTIKFVKICSSVPITSTDETYTTMTFLCFWTDMSKLVQFSFCTVCNSVYIFMRDFSTERESCSNFGLMKQHEPRLDKTCLRGFPPGPTKTRLYSHITYKISYKNIVRVYLFKLLILQA